MQKEFIQSKQKIVPYLFVLPFILSFLVFFLFPLISSIYMSFFEIFPGESTFVGTRNYSRMVNQRFWTALSNSFWYTVLTILVLVPLPVIFASLLNSDTTSNKTFRAMLFIPALVSVVVAGTIIRLLVSSGPHAVLNTIVQFFGGQPKNWLLAGHPYAMMLLVFTATWKWTGVNIVYFLAGLQAIPTELYESAHIDGANAIQRFFRITIPLLKPTIIFVTTISVFGGFAMFEESYILWAGNQSPNNVGLTMVGYLYQRGFQQGEFGTGSAVGVVLITVVFTISMLQLTLFGFFKKED